MTAVAERRRRGTQLALGLTLVTVVLAGALVFAGVRTLADSTAGRPAEGNGEARPVQRLPYTPTALVGTLDDTGRLTTVVVLAVEPDGTGGSIVQIAASADSNAGLADELRPLNAVLAVHGPDSLAFAAESLTGVSFDVVELIDQERFAQLVSPLGELPVDLPTTLYDASTGESWDVGEQVMPAAAAARALTAVDPMVDDYLFEPARGAVWRAVADRVGAGVGSATAVASGEDLPRPSDLDSVVSRLFAGDVQYRAFTIEPVDDDRIADQLPAELQVAFGAAATDAVVVHPRSEVMLLMASVAPALVGSPLEAPSFRLVSGFTEADLQPLGLTSTDVLLAAIDRLRFARVNVVSVADLPGSAIPDASTFAVAEAATVDGVRKQFTGGFGAGIDVAVAESLIENIDVELVLGRDFLPQVLDGVGSEVAGSGTDESSSA